jgi:hypothetical protein
MMICLFCEQYQNSESSVRMIMINIDMRQQPAACVAYVSVSPRSSNHFATGVYNS